MSLSRRSLHHPSSTDGDGYRGSQPRSTLELHAWHGQSPPVQALEPGLPIVDAHHHLFGTADDALHYRLQDLQTDLDSGHTVIGTVYVEAYQAGWRADGPEALRPVGEIEQIVGLTRTPVTCKRGTCHVAAAVVGNANLCLGDRVEAVLEAELMAGEGRLRGVRHHAATDAGAIGRTLRHPPRPHVLSDKSFREGFARLARHKLSFDAWIFHTQLDDVVALADAFPDTPVILNHAGTVLGVANYRTQRQEELARWRCRMRALALRPNVRVKIGGMGMPVFGFGFEYAPRPPLASQLVQAWEPFIELCVEAFGTERCLFESNFPVDRQSCSYVELWNAFKLVTAAYSADERADLFYRTACQTYRLPELEAEAARRAA